LFAADADLEIRIGGAARGDAHLHQDAHALDVQRLERVVMQDAGVRVERQELVLGILAREGIGRLRQVVGTEGEELGQIGQIGRAGTGAHGLDHGAELEGQVDAILVLDFGTDLVDAGPDPLQFLYGDDLRHHDFRAYRDAGLQAGRFRFQDGADLHLVDFRIGDAETNAAMAQHGVDFMEIPDFPQHQFFLGDDAVDMVFIDAAVGAMRLADRIHRRHRGGAALDGQPVFLERLDFIQQLCLAGQEFMHRRIEQAHRHRVRRDDPEHFLEILALHRHQFVQRRLTFLQGARHDHFDDHGQPFHGVEHAFGATQTDTLGAIFHGHLGHVRRIAVGHDLEAGFFIGPTEQGVQFIGEFRRQGRDFAQVNMAVGAIDGDDVPLAQGEVADLGETGAAVDRDSLGARHAGLAHAARDDGRVRGLAAAAGQNALGGKETMNVLGFGLLTHQDDLFTRAAQHFGLVGVKHAAAAGGAGRGGQTLRQGNLIVVRVQTRVQQLLEIGGVDPEQSLILADEPLGVHLDRGTHHRRGVHFAVAGLQAVENALLDRVFVVLDFPVMPFQLVPQFDELAVEFGHFVRHLGHGLGGTNAGDDVLALGVDQVFAIHLVFAGARIASEAHAGRAVVAHVAEHHRDDIDGGTVSHLRGDVEFTAVVDGPLARPGVEDGADADFELLQHILGEGLAGFAQDDAEEALAGVPQVFGIQGDVSLHAGGTLDGLEFRVEVFFLDPQGDLAEELNEAAVGVITETGIAGLLNQSTQGRLIESQIEDRIHHARHGHGGAGADRHEQRIGITAEFLARLQFQRLDIAQHLLHQFMRHDAPVQIFKAGFGGDDKAGWNIQADLGHFAEVGPLAAQQAFVLTVALFE